MNTYARRGEGCEPSALPSGTPGPEAHRVVQLMEVPETQWTKWRRRLIDSVPWGHRRTFLMSRAVASSLTQATPTPARSPVPASAKLPCHQVPKDATSCLRPAVPLCLLGNGV